MMAQKHLLAKVIEMTQLLTGIQIIFITNCAFHRFSDNLNPAVF